MLIGYLYGLFAALIWGSWLVITRLGVTTNFDGLDIALIRFGVSGIILFPVIIKKGLFIKKFYNLGSVILAFGGLPYIYFFSQGLTYSPTSHGALAPATLPVFTALFSYYIYKEKLSNFKILGLILSIIGVLMIMSPSLLREIKNTWISDLYFILAALCWSFYTVFSKQWNVDPLHGTAMVAVLSLIGTLVVYIFFGDFNNFIEADITDIIIQAIGQGLMTAILAFFFYNKAIKYLGSNKAALFAILMPVIGTLLAIPILSEIPSYTEMLGIFIISIGLALAFGLPLKFFSRSGF